MPFREAIARLALRDARRFEMQTAAMLRRILATCHDNATRTVLQEITAEEQQHLQRLEGAAGESQTSAPGPPPELPKMPESPDSRLPEGTVHEKLRAVLKKEEASATFYHLLAERTLIPAVREVFKEIAAQEKRHAERLAELIRRLSGASAGSEKKP